MMVLDQIADNVWVAEGACVNFYGFAYPTRSVVLRLANGDIWFWSPIAYDDNLAKQIGALGPIAHLVSPNKIHHLFLTQWARHFPDAKLWGPQTTIAKRDDLTFERALDNMSPAQWADEIDQFHATGSAALDEILFFHKPTGTVIMADFSENFSERFITENWRPWQRWIARKWGIVEGKGYAPLEWRLSFLKRAELKRIRRDLQSRPVNNVIMAHGEMQIANGQAFLKTCLAWI